MERRIRITEVSKALLRKNIFILVSRNSQDRPDCGTLKVTHFSRLTKVTLFQVRAQFFILFASNEVWKLTSVGNF